MTPATTSDADAMARATAAFRTGAVDEARQQLELLLKHSPADYDDDGDLDLFVSNHEMEAHTLFRNLGKGLFEDVTFPSGIGPPTLPFVGFGAAFLDLDNDTDLDLAVVNGHVMNSASHFRPGAKEAQRNLLLRNEVGQKR